MQVRKRPDRHYFRLHEIGLGKRLALCFLSIALVLMAGTALLLWQAHAERVQATRLTAIDQELIAVLHFHSNLQSFDMRFADIVLLRDWSLARQASQDLRAALMVDSRAVQSAFNNLPAAARAAPPVVITMQSIETSLPQTLDGIDALVAAEDWAALRERLRLQTGPLEFLISQLVDGVNKQVASERTQAVANIASAERMMLLIVLATGIVTLFIAAILGVTLTRSISKPLARLMEASRALARGHFEHRTEVVGKDELGQLGLVFNDTAAKLRDLYNNLRSREEKLQQSESELRIEVGERRTAEESLQRQKDQLENALEEIKRLRDDLHKENLALREQIDQAFMFEEIIGCSPPLKSIFSDIVRVAPTQSTVLVTGETGTGKELIARAIHKRSQRANGPFISINCASVPQALIASELFGHEKGAFTGAVQRREGRFELANGGTLFLDEVGELPAETQVSLLRVLQERCFERVGGTRSLCVDVRLIAATNRDLPAAIAQGLFREDLFYRLNVFPITLPPLRHRKEDIPVLVEYFTKRFADKAGKSIVQIDQRSMERCKVYEWPGNVRELQNIVERSVILCSGDTLRIESAWLSVKGSRADGVGQLPRSLQLHEKEMIEAALAESNGKVAGPHGAAVRLGIPRSTLDWKIKQLKISKRKFASKA